MRRASVGVAVTGDLSESLALACEALDRAEDQIRRDAKVKRTLAEQMCRLDRRVENAALTVAGYREFVTGHGMVSDYEQWAALKALGGTMLEAVYYTAVEYDGEIIEFVGRDKDDSERRARRFVAAHASARLVSPDWLDVPEIYWGEE